MSNNTSISFAKWFLNKHRDSGIFTDSDTFNLILSQLDHHTWDEFVASNSDTIADKLIPQLLQKTSNKPKQNKKIDAAKPCKPKKTRVDAQTSTHDETITDTIVSEVVVTEVTAAPIVADKKQPKTKKPKQTITAEVAEGTEGVVTEVTAPIVADKKQPKTKKPKQNITAEVVTEVAEGVVTEVTATIVADKKQPKTKKPKQTITAEVTEVAEGVVTGEEKTATIVADKKQPKTKKPKQTITADVAEGTEVAEGVVTEVTATIVADKKQPKTKKGKQTITAVVTEGIVTEGVVTGEEKTAPIVADKKQPKTKKGKQTITAEVAEGTEVVEGVVTGEEKTAPIVAEIANKDHKKRAHKKHSETYSAPDDVIVPVLEQSVLSEENYIEQQQHNENDETILTEIFVNDVIFYVDSDNNWFDSNLTSTTPQF